MFSKLTRKVQAHIHARNAKRKTAKSNPIAASEEHGTAAAYFAEAAESTSDPLVRTHPCSMFCMSDVLSYLHIERDNR